jgi:hypothetical protein
MVGATGKPFGSHKIKVEYGSLSKKPIYDKHSRKIILHVANLPDASLDHPDILRKKFDLFGSVEDAQVIKSKHIGTRDGSKTVFGHSFWSIFWLIFVFFLQN